MARRWKGRKIRQESRKERCRARGRYGKKVGGKVMYKGVSPIFTPGVRRLSAVIHYYATITGNNKKSQNVLNEEKLDSGSYTISKYVIIKTFYYVCIFFVVEK